MTVPTMPKAKYISTNGIKMAFYESGEGPAVVLTHGFPELAYSWRYQIQAIADAGFRVIIPDMRGYGDTEMPTDVKSYDIEHLTGDLVGLLDALGLDKAVFIGHDWGALVCWDLPSLHPDRILGIGALNVPYGFFRLMPEDPIIHLTKTKGMANYMVLIQMPKMADAVMAKDPTQLFHRNFRKGGIKPEDAALRSKEFRNLHFTELSSAGGDEFLSEPEVAKFVAVFTKTGFTGGLNYYRNISRNYKFLKSKPERIDVPCLMIEVPNDHFMPPGPYTYMRDYISDLEFAKIEDCGHWTQQEHLDEVNSILIDWLTRKFK